MAGAERSLMKGEDDPTFVWEKQPKKLLEILKEDRLPVVVRLSTENVLSSEKNSARDVHKPLLLYKEVKGRKIYGKNVTSVDVLTGAVCREDGPVVVIPEKYPGWFRLIDDLDKPLTTVANVARIMPVRFLCCKPVSGFLNIQKGSKSNPDGLYEKLTINPGVYNVLNIHEDFVRYIDKKKTVKNLMRCLKCSDNEGTEFLLPFESTGFFYLIESRKTTSKRLNAERCGYVYSIHSMMEAGLSKDVILSLMHGRPPATPCGFTSVLKICDIIKDHTIVASTLSSTPKLLELPIGPTPKFVKATNLDEVQNHPVFQKVQNYLAENADTYANEMKVRHNYNIQSTREGPGVPRLAVPQNGAKTPKPKQT
ncbi:uncharacterized protein LOC134236849 [Saccostrea cucullata]|uniref:uncharacterized protein LOC134236849 n=1 Tax=Saccostrea cuccullata TaxID=36930 RepID=UPI002ED364DF